MRPTSLCVFMYGGAVVGAAVGAVDAPYLRRQPVIGHAAALVQIAEDAFEKARVLGGADAAEIGDAADIPQQADRWRVGRPCAHLAKFGQRLERQQVVVVLDGESHGVGLRLLVGVVEAADGAQGGVYWWWISSPVTIGQGPRPRHHAWR